MLDELGKAISSSNTALFILFGTIFGCLFFNAIITLVIAHAMRHASKWPGNMKDLKQVMKNGETLRLCAVIGSGGHTTEMGIILKQLDPNLFKDRFYIVAETDRLGVDKVLEAETEIHSKFAQDKGTDRFEIKRIPRSREVGQSYITSVFTTIWATVSVMKTVWQIKPDVLICNGPGTCIPVCFLSYLLDLFRLRNTRIIFVESICRVKSLSLSGKIVYNLRMADFFLVQWQDLVQKYPRADYIGILL